ncbi:MAG: chloride channel protein family [Desulfovibrionales bacterium]|nr:chloride channel protein family [Desulfovibrionales bacterium]
MKTGPEPEAPSGRGWRPFTLPYLERLGVHDLRLVVFSLVIGVLAATGAVAFRFLIELFTELFWPGEGHLVARAMEAPWWLIVLLPTAAGLAVGPVITFYAPEVRGPGVSEVIKAVAHGKSAMRRRVTPVKALVTSLLLGAGASVGREGPIIQIGAAAGSTLASWLRLDSERKRVCLACGAAAGIAATFNAPLAGALFAVEVILLDIRAAFIANIIVSAISASLFSRLFLGDFPTMDLTHFAISSYWEMLIYLALGVLAGITAIVFLKALDYSDRLFSRIPIPEWTKPGLGGLCLGVMGLFLPQVLGVGYDTVNLAVADKLVLSMAVMVLAGKIAATSLCIGSGMSGGVFAPSLVIGSSLGAAVGILAGTFFPELGVVPGHYALAGMGAVVAGSTLAPITAVLTIFELTHSYKIMLPLMLGCISSAAIVRTLFGYSVYEMRLIRQGVDVVRGRDMDVLRDMEVSQVMSRDVPTLSEGAALSEIIQKVLETDYPHFVVVNRAGELAGVLSARDLAPCLGYAADLEGVVLARDIMIRSVITVTEGADMAGALEMMEEHHVGSLPVMSTTSPKRVVGRLKKDDVLHTYTERLNKSRLLSCRGVGKKQTEHGIRRT